MRSQRLFQNTFILRRSRVSLLKEPLKNKNYTKMRSMSVFLDIKKLIISAEKCRCHQNSRDMSLDLYIFGILIR